VRSNHEACVERLLYEIPGKPMRKMKRGFAPTWDDYQQEHEQRDETIAKEEASCMWVQCEVAKCRKWRMLPPGVDASEVPEHFVCKLNKWDPSKARCDIAQEDLHGHEVLDWECEISEDQLQPGDMVDAYCSKESEWEEAKVVAVEASTAIRVRFVSLSTGNTEYEEVIQWVDIKRRLAAHRSMSCESGEVMLFCTEDCKRGRLEDDTFMIGCERCDQWFHGECIGVSQAESDQLDQWLCKECEPLGPVPQSDLEPSTLQPPTGQEAASPAATKAPKRKPAGKGKGSIAKAKAAGKSRSLGQGTPVVARFRKAGGGPPGSKAGKSKVVLEEINNSFETLYCREGCRRNRKDTGWMIACDLCAQWYHGPCIGIEKSEAPYEYMCTECVNDAGWDEDPEPSRARRADQRGDSGRDEDDNKRKRGSSQGAAQASPAPSKRPRQEVGASAEQVPQVPLVVGNAHEKVEGEMPHQWTLFVRGEEARIADKDDLAIKEVEFFIHQDYEPSEITVKKPPFQVTRSGYAIFDTEVRIALKDGTEIRKHWDLNFDEALTFEQIDMTTAAKPQKATPRSKPKARSTPTADKSKNKGKGKKKGKPTKSS